MDKWFDNIFTVYLILFSFEHLLHFLVHCLVSCLLSFLNYVCILFSLYIFDLDTVFCSYFLWSCLGSDFPVSYIMS